MCRCTAQTDTRPCWDSQPSLGIISWVLSPLSRPTQFLPRDSLDFMPGNMCPSSDPIESSQTLYLALKCTESQLLFEMGSFLYSSDQLQLQPPFLPQLGVQVGSATASFILSSKTFLITFIYLLCIYVCSKLTFWFVCFSRQGFFMQPQLAWNQICRPGCP